MTTAATTDPIRILFVDDILDNYEVLRRAMSSAFGELNCPIEIDYVPGADEAYDRIETRGTPYEVVIADLLFQRPQSPGTFDARGIEVIEKARRTSQSTVVVAITQGDLSKPELEPKASEAGADIVLLRAHLMPLSGYGGPRHMVKEIYRLLCDRRLVDAGPELAYDDEPGVQLVLEDTDATGTTMRLLIADLLEPRKPEKAHLSHVTQGGSGAHVVRARMEFANGSHRTYLLKLDKNRDVLVQELANAQKAQGLYGATLTVHYLSVDRPVSRNGWCAIGMAFAEGATQLRDWLLLPAAAAAVPSLMTQLFLNGGLVAGYDPGLSDAGHTHPMQKLRLPAFRRVRVRAAIDLIEHSLGQIQPRLLPIPDLIKVIHDFVRNASIGDVHLTDVPVELHLVEAHGDLHGGNILVSGGDHPVPMIIDLANFDTHHWAADVARLASDLILRCVDRKTEWFSWQRFGLWRDLCRSMGDLVPLSVADEPHNDGVFTALNWLIEKRREVLIHIANPNHAWEWHIALAEQLLRGTYSTHLSDPKRALAAVAAYDQLMSAREKVPRNFARF